MDNQHNFGRTTSKGGGPGHWETAEQLSARSFLFAGAVERRKVACLGPKWMTQMVCPVTEVSTGLPRPEESRCRPRWLSQRLFDAHLKTPQA